MPSSPALHRFGAVLGFVFAASLASACAGTIGEAAGAVPRPVIEESLDTLDDRGVQQQIADVLSSPEYRDATDELLGNLADGTLDALSDEERRERLAELTDAFVAKMGESLGATMRRDLAPAVGAMIARTMDQSIEHALSEENRERIGAAIAAITREAIAALVVAVREEVAPAVAELLRDEEVKTAASEITRQMARDIVLGLEDGFQEIERRDERGNRPETIFTRLQDLANEGFGWMQFGLIALGVATTVLLVAWVIAWRRARSARADAARRDAALLAMLEAMKSTEGQKWGPELRAILKKSFRDNERAEYVRELLRKNRHLRLGDIDDDAHDAEADALIAAMERDRPSRGNGIRR
jgi:hypothetical protein